MKALTQKQQLFHGGPNIHSKFSIRKREVGVVEEVCTEWSGMVVAKVEVEANRLLPRLQFPLVGYFEAA
jgi:hypothetical protein